MAEPFDRGAPSGLRGWLSDVYLPALVAGQVDALVRRLGDRSSLDDPMFGRASGTGPLTQRLGEVSAWLVEHAAAYEKSGFVMGSDRDVTEGTLTVTVAGKRVAIPIAVVAERRRERAVELRVYYSTAALRYQPARASTLAQDDDMAVPPPVQAYLDACDRGDASAALASFEEGAVLRDSAGQVHAKTDGGGPLQVYFDKLFASGGALGGIPPIRSARADDGRVCVLEYAGVRLREDGTAQQAGLAAFERGESGSLRAVRVYGDVGPPPGAS